MASNLRAKIAESDTFIVHDVNETATRKFMEEHSGTNTKVADNVRQVAEQAVSTDYFPPRLQSLRMMSMFYL